MTASYHVLLVAEDLMLTSDVSQSCSLQEIPFSSVRANELIATLDGLSSDGALLLVDLEAPGLDPEQLSVALSHPSISQAVGYGPHVKTGLFDAARAAGLERLMSRGQFTAQAGGLIAEFCRLGSD